MEQQEYVMRRVSKQFLLPVIYVTLATVLLLVLVQPSTPVKAQDSESECWAVIVGIKDYQHFEDAPYSDDNAEELADQLSPAWGNEHIKLLTNSMATKVNIEDAITGWLASREDADDVVLFYWSGYFDWSGYLWPHDTSSMSHDNDISVDDLDSWLRTLDSEKVVVMNVPGSEFLDGLSAPGRIVLAASRVNETCYWSSDLEHDVFTYYILEALSHFENVDSNDNLELSVEEIFDYVQRKTGDYVSRFWYTTQKPQMSDSYAGELSLLIKVTADVAIETAQATNILRIDGQSYSLTNLPVSFIWAPSHHNLEAVSPVSGENGTRYVFDSWDDGNSSASRTVSGGDIYNADYTTQYYLSIESDYGEPEGEGWYDSRSTATISVITPVEDTSTTHYFTGWSGDYSGNEATASVYVDEPKTVTAEWRTEYLLTIESDYGEPEGEGWYDSRSTATISVVTPVEDTATTHYFTGWSGDYSGNEATASVYVDEPKTVTAEWRTEYLLTIESDYGEPEGEGWYDEGASATFSVTSPEGMIVRQVFTGWSGDYSGDTTSASIIMDGPKTFTVEWKTDIMQLYIVIIAVVVILGAFGVWFIVRKRGKARISVAESVQPSPPPMRCANCGAELGPSDKFCIKCGTPVRGN